MRRKLSVLLRILLIIAIALLGAAAYPAKTMASEVTVSGTVTDSTNTEMLYLNTSDGTMHLKMDSNTDTSGVKFILPGSTVTCKIYLPNDGYWHISKITGVTAVGKVSVDTSSPATVRGTIAKGTTSELIYLVVDNGTMQIKIDNDTDLSNCRYLIIGKTVSVSCGRGSDAYMHAISISDANTYSVNTYSSSSGSATSKNTVSGTIDKGTTTSLLRLATSAGTMEFVMDLATDISSCRALIPGQSATVSFYRGDDAWNHVSKIINGSSAKASDANLDQSSRATVNGTIANNTNEGLLYLNTNDGTMQIKIDNATGFGKCPVLLIDKSAQVVCVHGSDGYLHAVTINADY